jgi:histidyl-tRNA synthetase
MGRIPSPEEQAQGVVKIRDMRLRSELTVDLDDLAKELTAQLP